MDSHPTSPPESVDSRELARLIVASTRSDEVSAWSAIELPPSSFEPMDSPIESAGPIEIETRRFEELPKELGVLLTSVGVLGFILPGIAGTPALIAGGLVLWPRTFGKVEGWFSRRFPKVHRQSMQQVGRFLDDLDRRYPPAG